MLKQTMRFTVTCQHLNFIFIFLDIFIQQNNILSQLRAVLSAPLPVATENQKVFLLNEILKNQIKM